MNEIYVHLSFYIYTNIRINSFSLLCTSNESFNCWQLFSLLWHAKNPIYSKMTNIKHSIHHWSESRAFFFTSVAIQTDKITFMFTSMICCFHLVVVLIREHCMHSLKTRVWLDFFFSVIAFYPPLHLICYFSCDSK